MKRLLIKITFLISGMSSLLALTPNDYPQSLPSIGCVSVLHQDDFYKDEKTLFQENIFFDEEMKYHNWELPECFDKDQFREEFLLLKESGGAVPITSSGIKTSEDKATAAAASSSSSSQVIILEGILIFEDLFLTSQMTERYFLDLSKDKCFARRKERDYFPPEPEGYFDKYYWPSYLDIKQNIADRVSDGSIEVTYLDSENDSIENLLARLTDDIAGIF